MSETKAICECCGSPAGEVLIGESFVKRCKSIWDPYSRAICFIDSALPMEGKLTIASYPEDKIREFRTMVEAVTKKEQRDKIAERVLRRAIQVHETNPMRNDVEAQINRRAVHAMLFRFTRPNMNDVVLRKLTEYGLRIGADTATFVSLWYKDQYPPGKEQSVERILLDIPLLVVKHENNLPSPEVFAKLHLCFSDHRYIFIILVGDATISDTYDVQISESYSLAFLSALLRELKELEYSSTPIRTVDVGMHALMKGVYQYLYDVYTTQEEHIPRDDAQLAMIADIFVEWFKTKPSLTEDDWEDIEDLFSKSEKNLNAVQDAMDEYLSRPGGLKKAYTSYSRSIPRAWMNRR